MLFWLYDCIGLFLPVMYTSVLLFLCQGEHSEHWWRLRDRFILSV